MLPNLTDLVSVLSFFITTKPLSPADLVIVSTISRRCYSHSFVTTIACPSRRG
ncbi:unnamed protein product [Brassica napus]|uniref:(rape) hypothetical protein n=1 Tax=Brassica napus TaxID=3708 RepID=A0A816IG86_BRANA|nr:unnamed protein product [Brassica napus]